MWVLCTGSYGRYENQAVRLGPFEGWGVFKLEMILQRSVLSACCIIMRQKNVIMYRCNGNVRIWENCTIPQQVEVATCCEVL